MENLIISENFEFAEIFGYSGIVGKFRKIRKFRKSELSISGAGYRGPAAPALVVNDFYVERRYFKTFVFVDFFELS